MLVSCRCTGDNHSRRVFLYSLSSKTSGVENLGKEMLKMQTFTKKEEKNNQTRKVSFLVLLPMAISRIPIFPFQGQRGADKQRDKLKWPEMGKNDMWIVAYDHWKLNYSQLYFRRCSQVLGQWVGPVSGGAH